MANIVDRNRNLDENYRDQGDGTYAAPRAALAYAWDSSITDWIKVTADHATGGLNVVFANPTSVVSGAQNVTTAGTRVQLATNACKSMSVKAKSSNTGLIYLGDVTVASTNGYQLGAGESVSFDIDNTNRVYIDSSVSGEGVTFMAVN